MKNRTTTTHQEGSHEINISRTDGVPYAFEIYHKDTTNDAGYHAEGCLEVIEGKLEDYDGVYCLPNAVAKILRAEGIFVSDDCLSITH